MRAVVGSGMWGTTLALQLARSGPVVLLARDAAGAEQLRAAGRNEAHLPGVAFPAALKVSHDPAILLDAIELVILAVPAQHMRSTLRRIAEWVPPTSVLLSVAKGLEASTLLRMTQVVSQEVAGADGRVAALSGPNLAPEIARGLPASSVVGAADDTLGMRVVASLGSRGFRLYRNRDVIGVELGGALKNVIAIAAGAADQLGLGNNGKAAIITRGLAEMTRLGVAAGANPLTFAGLAGIGDVLATCSSSLSRNHRLGMELAAGRSWRDIEATLPGVAEGAYTVSAALDLAQRLGVELPIAREVRRALYEGKAVQECLHDLLDRESRDELDGPGGLPGPSDEARRSRQATHW